MTPAAPEQTRLVVFDTSPLAYLCDAGALNLLEERYGGRAVIPDEVLSEFRRGMAAGRHEQREPLLTASWWRPFRVETLEDVRLFENLRLRWGQAQRNRGEAAVLVAARRLRASAVIDDRQGATAARDLGIPSFGLLRILCMLVAEDRLSLAGAWALHTEISNLGFRSPIVDGRQLEQLVERIRRGEL